MSEQPKLERPRQVTMAGWVGGVASAMMLASVFTLMPKLRSIGTRQAINEYLTSGAGRALGIDLDQALVLARIGLFVTAAAAAATLVFTVFVMRRDRQSRIALTVMALPIMVCGVFVDPFLAGFILASIVLVWTRPASDWFAGRTPQPLPQSAPTMPDLPPLARRPDGRAAEPPPFPGYGRPSDSAGERPPPATAPDQAPYRWPAARTTRPAAVTVACVISLLASAGTGFLLALGVAVAGTDGFRTQLETQLRESGNADRLGSVDELVVVAQVLAVMAVLWCLSACALAVFAFLGHGWARIMLAVSAIVAAVLSLLAVISFQGFLVLTLAASGVAVLLFRGDSARWYAVARGRPAHPPPPRPPSGSW
ncbi:MAG TPA: hypothetical protein VFJ22_05270 [Dermatophilaceae bacterium]|nr:hypothetical protein [Dermatophilaceae bacterium]